MAGRGRWRASCTPPRRIPSSAPTICGRSGRTAPGPSVSVPSPRGRRRPCAAPLRTRSRRTGRRREGRAAAVADALADLHRGVTRRDVVRAWCRGADEGAPAHQVEEQADRLLAEWRPEPRYRGEAWSGCGRAPARGESPSLRRDSGIDRRRAQIERSELSRLLADHGVGLDRRPNGGRTDEDLGMGPG